LAIFRQRGHALRVGVRATGGYWVNWDPHTFVECGIQGSLGGWTPEVGGTRQLVSGDVAVLGPDGTIKAIPADEIEDPARALTTLPGRTSSGSCGPGRTTNDCSSDRCASRQEVPVADTPTRTREGRNRSGPCGLGERR
jgi:hypothetical protein